MTNANKYLKYLDEEYNIYNIAFLDLFLVFTTFLTQHIEADEKLDTDEKQDLNDVMSSAYRRLEDRKKSTASLNKQCWDKHHELERSHPYLSNYYRILATLFTHMPFYEDPLGDLEPIEVCLTLLNKLDETLPEKFYEYFKQKALETIF